MTNDQYMCRSVAQASGVDKCCVYQYGVQLHLFTVSSWK